MTIYTIYNVCLAPSKRSGIGTSKNRVDVTAYPSQDIVTLVI